jgi:hypothetical protein
LDLEQQTRRTLFSKFVNKKELGLEIGPSYRPTFPKKEGWTVKVVDHCSKPDLIEKYQELKVPKSFLSAIEEVDYVWRGESYAKLMSASDEKLRYVIACHVIEHVEDLIGFLSDMSEIIDHSGYLLLAIPDKKSTFDFYRPISTLGDVILANLSPEIYDVKAKIDEDYLRSEFAGTIAWNQDVSRAKISAHEIPTPSINFEKIKEDIRKLTEFGVKSNDEYRDGHRWVFTLNSFIDVIRALSSLEMTNFEIIEYEETNYYEFLVVLKKVETIERQNIRSREFLLDLVPIIDLQSENQVVSQPHLRFLRKWTPKFLKKSVRRLFSAIKPR